jgi:hypothetical protein
MGRWLRTCALVLVGMLLVVACGQGGGGGGGSQPQGTDEEAEEGKAGHGEDHPGCPQADGGQTRPASGDQAQSHRRGDGDGESEGNKAGVDSGLLPELSPVLDDEAPDFHGLLVGSGGAGPGY